MNLSLKLFQSGIMYSLIWVQHVIPDRYVTLIKSQVKFFREDQIELFRPKNTSGRSERQMVVYYNVLNILGDRMAKDQAATITLVELL